MTGNNSLDFKLRSLCNLEFKLNELSCAKIRPCVDWRSIRTRKLTCYVCWCRVCRSTYCDYHGSEEPQGYIYCLRYQPTLDLKMEVRHRITLLRASAGRLLPESHTKQQFNIYKWRLSCNRLRTYNNNCCQHASWQKCTRIGLPYKHVSIL